MGKIFEKYYKLTKFLKYLEHEKFQEIVPSFLDFFNSEFMKNVIDKDYLKIIFHTYWDLKN